MSGEHDLDMRQGSSANDTIEGATGEFVAVLGGGGDDHIDVTDAGDDSFDGDASDDSLVGDPRACRWTNCVVMPEACVDIRSSISD